MVADDSFSRTSEANSHFTKQKRLQSRFTLIDKLTIHDARKNKLTFPITAHENTLYPPSVKVGREEGSCCRDMLQRQKTCVVHTEATCSRDV